MHSEEINERNQKINIPLIDTRLHPEIFRSNDNPPGVIRKNKIISEKVYFYSFKQNVIQDSILRTQLFYNETGDIEKVDKYKGTTILSTTMNTYTSEGLPVKSVTSYTGGKANTTQIEQYEYDSLGLESFIYLFNADTSSVTIKQKVYDENGQCIKTLNKYNNNKEFTTINEYEYDAEGKLIRKGEVVMGYDLLFEYKGTPVKELNVYTRAGKSKSKSETYYFNDKMQIIRIERWDILIGMDPQRITAINSRQSENKEVSVFVYNPDGTLSQNVRYIDNQIVTIRRHYYSKGS